MDSGGPAIPGIFIFFFVVIVLIGVGSTLYRISTARNIARRNGMDVGDATAVALLNDNGLSAAYLRSGMQHPRSMTDPASGPAAPQPTPPPSTPEQRLQDLENLHNAGRITDEEYAAARKRIVDSL